MIQIIIAACVLILTSCSSSPQHKMAYKLMNSFASKMNREEHLHAYKISGNIGDSIKMFKMEFNAQRIVTLQESRKLFIKILNIFIEGMNKFPPAKPYLHTYPSTFNETNFSITFTNFKGDYPQKEYISLVFNDFGVIHYCVHNKRTNRFDKIYQETYQEALSKLDNNNGEKS